MLFSLLLLLHSIATLSSDLFKVILRFSGERHSRSMQTCSLHLKTVKRFVCFSQRCFFGTRVFIINIRFGQATTQTFLLKLTPYTKTTYQVSTCVHRTIFIILNWHPKKKGFLFCHCNMTFRPLEGANLQVMHVLS